MNDTLTGHEHPIWPDSLAVPKFFADLISVVKQLGRCRSVGGCVFHAAFLQIGKVRRDECEFLGRGTGGSDLREGPALEAYHRFRPQM